MCKSNTCCSIQCIVCISTHALGNYSKGLLWCKHLCTLIFYRAFKRWLCIIFFFLRPQTTWTSKACWMSHARLLPTWLKVSTLREGGNTYRASFRRFWGGGLMLALIWVLVVSNPGYQRVSARLSPWVCHGWVGSQCELRPQWFQAVLCVGRELGVGAFSLGLGGSQLGSGYCSPYWNGEPVQHWALAVLKSGGQILEPHKHRTSQICFIWWVPSLKLCSKCSVYVPYSLSVVWPFTQIICNFHGTIIEVLFQV